MACCSTAQMATPRCLAAAALLPAVAHKAWHRAVLCCCLPVHPDQPHADSLCNLALEPILSVPQQAKRRCDACRPSTPLRPQVDATSQQHSPQRVPMPHMGTPPEVWHPAWAWPRSSSSRPKQAGPAAAASPPQTQPGAGLRPAPPRSQPAAGRGGPTEPGSGTEHGPPPGWGHYGPHGPWATWLAAMEDARRQQQVTQHGMPERQPSHSTCCLQQRCLLHCLPQLSRQRRVPCDQALHSC